MASWKVGQVGYVEQHATDGRSPIVYIDVINFIILKALDAVIGLRIFDDQET